MSSINFQDKHTPQKTGQYYTPVATKKTKSKNNGISLEHALFADLIASGLPYSEAYRRAFPDSSAKQESIHVIACRLANKPQIKARITELKKSTECAAVARDRRVLDADWLRLEVLSGLYSLATSSESDHVRLSAWEKLANTRVVDLMAPKGPGVSVNVQNNQLGGTNPNNADEIRASLVRELHALAPLQITDGDVED